MTTTKEKIVVMQAYTDGKQIEVANACMFRWRAEPNPTWDWFNFVYRVAPTKPSWNWDHVSDEINYLARTSGGEGIGLTSRPYLGDRWSSRPYLSDRWWRVSGGVLQARYIASYDPGTCDWQDSLVVRPGYVEAAQ